MPKYDPDIHDPLIISLHEFDFVQALMDIESPTFSNYYQSAIKAGYADSYARVIGHYFPKERIKRVMKTMKDPFAQSIAKRMREEPEDFYYQPSKREQKRLRAEGSREFKELRAELLKIDY